MPIEIRPSDVMFGLSKVLSQGQQLATGIFDAEAEKERVKEVNDGLILSEMARQKDRESYQDPKKVIEVYPETSDPNGAPLMVGTPQYKALGDVPQSVIEAELQKHQTALEQEINLTTHNKRAREELIARSRMAAIGHRDKVIGEWRSAAQGVYLHGVKDYATLLTMDETTPVDGLIGKMEDRMAEGIGSGWITRDAADTYLVTFEDQLQQSRALNGALKLASQTETVEKGTMAPITPASEDERYADTTGQATGVEKPFDFTVTKPITPEQAVANAEEYLNSIPYYKNKPEERDKIFGVVLRKYVAMTQANDAAVDSKYAMIHLQAGTVEAIDMALAELETEKIYDGDKRYTWEMRLRASKEDMLREIAAGAKAGASTEEGIELLDALFFSDKTTEEYVKGISDLKMAGKITSKTAREWMVKDSQRSGLQNRWKLGGKEAIEKSFDAAISRVKLGTKPADQKKYVDLLVRKERALAAYTQAIAGKTSGDGPEIMAIAATYAWVDMPPQAEWNVNEIDFTDKGKVAALVLAVKKQEVALTPDATGKLAGALSTMITKDFGAKGVQMGSNRAYGVPTVIVKGLEPGRPDTTFTYFLDVNDAGELVMMRWNLKDDPEPTMAPTLQVKRAADVKAATAEAAGKKLTGAEATQYITGKVGGEPLTAAELKPIPAGKLPGEVDISAKQLQQFYGWIKGKKTLAEFTPAMIEEFSNTSGIPVWQLENVLKNRYSK